MTPIHTHLHFCLHDIVNNTTPTSMRVAQSTITSTSFGFIDVADDKLTVGPQPNSTAVDTMSTTDTLSCFPKFLLYIASFQFKMLNDLRRDRKRMATNGNNYTTTKPPPNPSPLRNAKFFQEVDDILLASTLQFCSIAGFVWLTIDEDCRNILEENKESKALLNVDT
ncbi:hypothetical protein L6452_39206 [Arctium lappa]|uniref:Uncharacterized protein n=1 Tax=Arctium lappa TaxID=4217 RepID=A0ACB8XRV7_ARCLA|nr:hypothetical protein L6452_39206 [Arctium lappa]